jgi:hypothetical protein
MFSTDTLQAAHHHCTRNEAELATSSLCGCFYCLRVFYPAEIEDWTDDESRDQGPRTALCPKCGIDSVIGDASGYDVEALGFLPAMHAHWFERSVTLAEASRQILVGRVRQFFSAFAARLGVRRP